MANGQVIQGHFGNVGAVDAPGTSADPSSAAGNPVTSGDTQKQLALIAHNAQVAATRLIQIPAPGSVPKDLLDSLLATYTTIQGNIADVLSRVGTADATAAAAKDAVEVQAQTQAFIDGVETAIRAAAPATTSSTALAPVKREIPWMLIGAGGLGLVAIGIGVYQYQKAQAGASARAARAARRPAFAGVAAGGRSKRKKHRKKSRFVEE